MQKDKYKSPEIDVSRVDTVSVFAASNPNSSLDDLFEGGTF